LMDQLVDTAAKTPFDLQGIADGARRLLAYGENVENINDDLIRLGNIAAGLSQPLGDIVYLYGTTMTQGRLYTQDLNQFTGRGIPMIRELAQILGVAENKVRELVEEGKVGFPEVQKVIQNLTNEGGMFYNLMEEQSKTITGQISNIQDALSSMFNTIGNQSEGVINDSLDVVSSLIENYEQVGRVLMGLVATYGVYRTACMAVAAAQGLQAMGVGTLTAAEAIHYGWLVVVEKAQKLLNATMLANPYVLIATLLAGVTAALLSMKTETERMKEAEEEYQAQKQKTIEAEDEHKRKIEDLCSIASNEAVATDTRREALNKLEMKYPDIFAKYDTEYEKLKNIKQIKEEIAQLEAQESITNPKTELKDVEARIKELEGKTKWATQYYQDSYGQHRARNVLKSARSRDEEAELQNLYNKRKALSEQIRKNDVNAYFENLPGVRNET
ncbi:tape measure protein, partial [Enterobacter hormaechei]|nr:tape measure protein [Enterobacter hormaechei]